MYTHLHMWLMVGANRKRGPYPALYTAEVIVDEFIYDGSQDFELNFQRWYVLNCDERMYYNEPTYSIEDGKEIFADMEKLRWQADPKKKSPS